MKFTAFKIDNHVHKSTVVPFGLKICTAALVSNLTNILFDGFLLGTT